MRSGLWFAVTRFGLLRYVTSRQHVRNWRPVILVLVGNPQNRLSMIRFAHGLEARRGFLFLAQIVTGAWSELLSRQAGIQDALRSFIQEHRLTAVPKTVIADDFEHGVATLIQVTGIGEFQPNTVMVGWSGDEMKREGFTRAIRHILELERNLVVFREANELHTDSLEPTIDVWWYAKDNGSFMATLAYLLKGDKQWARHTIRVLRIIQDPAGAADATAGTRQVINELRIDAEVSVIVSDDPPLDVIARTSERSAITFIGMAVSSLSEDRHPLDMYASHIERLKGTVLLTKSWHDLKY
jgi:hypothetical protein